MIGNWLRGFLPAPVGVSRAEQLRGAAGALLGLLLTGLVSLAVTGPGAALPLLIAPFGASAVLLFAVPASPLAQPWSIIGGNTVSAIIGVTCALWLPDPLVAAPFAVSLAIGAMFALRCLHPPGGAVALTAVVGGPAVTAAGYHFVLFPVLVNSAMLMLAAVAFNNVTRRAYPHVVQPAPGNRHQTADRSPSERLGVRAEDLDAVLSRYDQILDISRDDLGNLVQQAEIHAYRRRFGEITCAAIMSRDVIAVQSDTPLAEAWRLLRRHDIRALPVVDPARRVIGMVSDLDFIRDPDLEPHQGLGTRFRRIISTAGRRSGPPDVVGQIMPSTIRTVYENMHVAELVPLMADAGLRHVPVVNGEGRLSGIIAQSDLIAALYRGSLAAEGASAASKAA